VGGEKGRCVRDDIPVFLGEYMEGRGGEGEAYHDNTAYDNLFQVQSLLILNTYKPKKRGPLYTYAQ